MKCDQCGKNKEISRLPNGWKKHHDKIWCESCWRAAYTLRAIAVPIVGPVIHGEWPEFAAAVKAAWGEITRLTNWANDQMYAGDVRRDSSMKKCPPMPKQYHYPAARQFTPSLPSQTVASTLQTAQKKYRQTRYDVLWTGERTTPNARYPQPFTAPNQGWSLELRDGRPVVSVRIGEKRWELYLRSGPEFHRQKKAMAQIVEGVAAPGELAIYRVRTGGRDAANLHTERSDAGAKVSYRMMAKMVAWLPRPPAQERAGVLRLRTDADAILVALDEKGERIWTEHADHLRRWTTEHARRLIAWSDDSKAEQRPVPTFSARRASMVAKQKNRVSSALSEIASHVVGLAVRRRYAQIEYDDKCRSFAAIPWAELLDKIERKCHEENLIFSASAQVVKGETEIARDELSHE